jgi:hypothetical protein
VVNHQILYHKRAKGLNKNLGGFLSYIAEHGAKDKCWRCGGPHRKKDCPNLPEATISNPNPSQPCPHCKAKGPNMKSMGVSHFTLLNKGERISGGGVVGHIRRRIVLIFLKWPPPTPIPTNLAPNTRHMAMMLTIVSRFTHSYNKVNPRQEMWESPKVLARAKRWKVWAIKGQPLSYLQISPMPWRYGLHVWRHWWQVWHLVWQCEELLHTFTTKICTHNKKTRLEVELLCSVV